MDKEKCRVPQCGRKRKRDGNLLCSSHYRIKSKGLPLDTPIGHRGPAAKGECSVDGCDRDATCSTLCATHYQYRRIGKELVPLGPAKKCPRGLSAKERFEKYFVPSGIDECWEWTGSRKENGYGQLGFSQRSPRGAHVLSYEFAHNVSVPRGMEILHSCDNPPCVNPNHLSIGTHKQNVHDMIARGRAAWQR